MTNAQKGRSYSCWLGYDPVEDAAARELGQVALRKICLQADGATGECIAAELKRAAQGLFDLEPEMVSRPSEASLVVGVGLAGDQELDEEGFLVQELTPSGSLQIAAKTDRGLLYGVFAFLRELRLGRFLLGKENPAVPLRMLNHWDNLDGSVERGYAGTSIFWDGGGLASDLSRVADYARLLASVGINGISVNNVNVHADETALIGPKLPLVARLADIFRPWGSASF